MSQVNGISLLRDLILQHDLLKVEDRSAVIRLFDLLVIRVDPALVNEYFSQQVEAEALACYLQNRYAKLVDTLDELLTKQRADSYVVQGDRNDQGLKWTKETREYWLLGTNAHYNVRVEQLNQARRLQSLIKDVTTIVFKRHDKLEQLSNNYRRETSIDNRTA